MPESLLLRLLYRIVPQAYYEYTARGLKGLPGRKMLDVGSGAGQLAGIQKERYTVGLDVDVELLKMGKGERVLGSACFSPFRNSSFDLVVFHDSLHHLEDPAKGIEEAVRVLKEGGHLAIFDFDLSHPSVKLLSLIERLAGFPAKFMRLKDLKKLPGLEPVKWEKGRLGTFFLVFKRVGDVV